MGLPRQLSGRVCLPKQETEVQSLSGENPLEEEIATHSSILAWENPVDTGAWQATVQGATKSWTGLSVHTSLHAMTVPWGKDSDRQTEPPLLPHTPYMRVNSNRVKAQMRACRL